MPHTSQNPPPSPLPPDPSRIAILLNPRTFFPAHPTVTMASSPPVTLESLPALLERDTCVKLAGLDADGILRGKLVSKAKFLSAAASGLGFCSVTFGWDMHDRTYVRELGVSNVENGYRDIVAVPDLASFRRIPWEDDVPFFLVDFRDPDTGKPLAPCPRGLLKGVIARLGEKGYGAMAGGKLLVFPLPKSPWSQSLPFLQG